MELASDSPPPPPPDAYVYADRLDAAEAADTADAVRLSPPETPETPEAVRPSPACDAVYWLAVRASPPYGSEPAAVPVPPLLLRLPPLLSLSTDDCAALAVRVAVREAVRASLSRCRPVGEEAAAIRSLARSADALPESAVPSPKPNARRPTVGAPSSREALRALFFEEHFSPLHWP